MPRYLRITVTFLGSRFHGRADAGEPEWPPSPLRLFQALVAASAGRWNERTELMHASPALRWFEAQPHPTIVAGGAVAASHPYRLYVPDNVTDKVGASWSKGRDASIADYRTEKDVCPMHLSDETVHYLYPLPDGICPHLDILTAAARSITHLGWGIDMVAGDAGVISAEQAAALSGFRWQPTQAGGTALRVPGEGTLDDLMRKHQAFLGRLSHGGFRPVPPLRAFRVRGYRRTDEPVPRPYRVLELRQTDGSRFRYPHRQLIHLAGMLRHLAIAAMKLSPTEGVDGNWIETYVAGHLADGQREHRQLSYLPLPSLGRQHPDPGVRRIMIAAPFGDDAWLDHLARRLAGQRLKPLRGDEFGVHDPPVLVPLKGDTVSHSYTAPAHTWHSFTPVILPGHDDHKPEKTRKLIEKALAQSGVDQPCEFEWSAFSRFPKSLSAHKYDRDRRPTGYIRPDHLLSQTAVHLTLRFKDGLKVPGPLTVGAGRHCGLGLFAALESS
ncbi:MAG: type I-U CRISPR-associated protein Csb2 [Planctomycetes bacterium]|nr:type I-U CRISPR-associated protein Csb2 [Planctomycetota bacterium]